MVTIKSMIETQMRNFQSMCYEDQGYYVTIKVLTNHLNTDQWESFRCDRCVNDDVMAENIIDVWIAMFIRDHKSFAACMKY